MQNILKASNKLKKAAGDFIVIKQPAVMETSNAFTDNLLIFELPD